jgi:phage-related minor tail protein
LEQQKLIDWLKEDIASVKSEVKDINSKVDELLKFKWQIVSGSVIISAIVGTVIQIFLAVYGSR